MGAGASSRNGTPKSTSTVGKAAADVKAAAEDKENAAKENYRDAKKKANEHMNMAVEDMIDAKLGDETNISLPPPDEAKEKKPRKKSKKDKEKGHSTSGSTKPKKKKKEKEDSNAPPGPGGVTPPPKGDAKVEKIALTDGVIQDYINLEKSIYRYERKNVIKKYESKSIFADDLKKTVDQLEATYKELRKQTEKEKTDVENLEQPSVKTFLKQQGLYDQRFSKEKQDYLDALNKQEIAEKELRMAREQHHRAAKIAEIYKQQVDNLNALYDQQDKTLAGIFGTEYASEKENVLEGEVDDLIEWQQRVALAMFKWTNARALLVHANTQMAFGITRWQELKSIEHNNTRMRYFAAAEARNNFIAAGQNVQSCRVYLGKVQFPYATEQEMNTLESTVNSAFKDSLKVYQDTHKKIAALIQWFDKVINDTIRKDLDKANNKVVKKQKALREERLALMKKKVKQDLGKDMKFDYDDIDDDDLEQELLALEAEAVKDQNELPGENLTDILNLSQPEGRDPSPLPASKLAPLPGKDALFGDVKQKLDEYDKTRKTFENRNNLQREKQAIALQEKLKLRQQSNRRTRKERRKSVIVPPTE